MGLTRRVKIDEKINEYRNDEEFRSGQVADEGKGIYRSVQWPKFLYAAKATLLCMLASAIIGALMLAYDTGVGNFIKLFMAW